MLQYFFTNERFSVLSAQGGEIVCQLLLDLEVFDHHWEGKASFNLAARDYEAQAEKKEYDH